MNMNEQLNQKMTNISRNLRVKNEKLTNSYLKNKVLIQGKEKVSPYQKNEMMVFSGLPDCRIGKPDSVISRFFTVNMILHSVMCIRF